MRHKQHSAIAKLAKALNRQPTRDMLVVEAVAQFVESFDPYVLHDFRLSDCIRLKFNQLAGRARRNPNGYTWDWWQAQPKVGAELAIGRNRAKKR
jgi:predicted transcriptional regulator